MRVLEEHPLLAKDCPDGADKFNCSHVVSVIERCIVEALGPPRTKLDKRRAAQVKFFQDACEIWKEKAERYELDLVDANRQIQEHLQTLRNASRELKNAAGELHHLQDKYNSLLKAYDQVRAESVDSRVTLCKCHWTRLKKLKRYRVKVNRKKEIRLK